MSARTELLRGGSPPTRWPSTIVELPGFEAAFTTRVKLEGLNPAGSIKLKAAQEMLDEGERSGVVGPGAHIIESSSGNLGAALSSLCAQRGYRLTVVSDPAANPHCLDIIRASGAEVIIVRERDRNRGFLGTRLEVIRRQLADRPGLVWLNQYANPANVRAHRRFTAVEIFESATPPDWLFVGASTGGTLMGCVSYVRARGLPTRVVGVDTEGSVLFDGPPGPRHLPGIGTSRKPELLVDDGSFVKVSVPELAGVRMCRRVAREYGLVLGGSSGVVLAAVAQLGAGIPGGSEVMTISPDMGYAYLDTVYDDAWVARTFGAAPDAPGTGPTTGSETV